jgi:hypothetical protein
MRLADELPDLLRSGRRTGTALRCTHPAPPAGREVGVRLAGLPAPPDGDTEPVRIPLPDRNRGIVRQLDMKHGSVPWNSGGAKRGRPSKEPARGTGGCQWPERHPPETCGRKPVAGLMLCSEHAKILDQRAGRACAWPGCSQTAPFEALCTYHAKRALGLLGPYHP